MPLKLKDSAFIADSGATPVAPLLSVVPGLADANGVAVDDGPDTPARAFSGDAVEDEWAVWSDDAVGTRWEVQEWFDGAAPDTPVTMVLEVAAVVEDVSVSDDESATDEMPARLAVAANGHDEIWENEEMPARLAVLTLEQDDGGFSDEMPARLSIPVTMQDSMGADDAMSAPASGSATFDDAGTVEDAMPARLVLRATFSDSMGSHDSSPKPLAAGDATVSDSAGFTDEIHALLVVSTTFQDSMGSDDAAPEAMSPAALSVPIGWYLAGAGVTPTNILRYGDQVVGTISGVVGGSLTIERYLSGIPAGRSLATARLNVRLRLSGATVVQKVISTSAGAAGQIIDDGSGLAKRARIQFLLGSADTVLIGTRRLFYDLEIVDNEADTTVPEVGLTGLTT